jgi:hypothetical protein
MARSRAIGVGRHDLYFGRLELTPFARESRIVSDVLDAHVRGYSTTTDDLLHDLFPA